MVVDVLEGEELILMTEQTFVQLTVVEIPNLVNGEGKKEDVNIDLVV